MYAVKIKKKQSKTKNKPPPPPSWLKLLAHAKLQKNKF